MRNLKEPRSRRRPRILGTSAVLVFLLTGILANAQGNDLISAAKDGDLTKVKVLIKQKPGLVFSKDERGWTPLAWAAQQGNREVAEALLSGKADVNAKDYKRLTPLHRAAGNGFKDVTELLLAYHADVNARSDEGATPLSYAARNGQNDVVALLLINHADVDAKSNIGTTPLQAAVRNGHKDVAEMLLKDNAAVNAKELNDGLTPLHMAAILDEKDIAELLLAYHADVNAKDKYGQTPLEYAESKGNNDVSVLLRQHSTQQDTGSGGTPGATRKVTKQANAGNLSGSWSVKVVFLKKGTEDDSLGLHLKQTGTTISGTTDGNWTIKGTAIGSSVSLTVAAYFGAPTEKQEAPGPPGTITLRPATAVNLVFHGTVVTASTMRGTVNYGQHGGLGNWTAQRSD